MIFQLTPDRLLGRVRSVTKLVAWGTIPAGILLGGFLAGAIGPVQSLIVLAAILLAVAVVATFSTGMRQVSAE